jgi:hypothetical protein
VLLLPLVLHSLVLLLPLLMLLMLLLRLLPVSPFLPASWSPLLSGESQVSKSMSERSMRRAGARSALRCARRGVSSGGAGSVHVRAGSVRARGIRACAQERAGSARAFRGGRHRSYLTRRKGPRSCSRLEASSSRIYITSGASCFLISRRRVSYRLFSLNFYLFKYFSY